MDTETIHSVDDLDLNNVRENKNLKIAAKKIRDKYRRQRKRKAAISVPEAHKIADTFVQIDKAALLAAKNISKKYKNIRRYRGRILKLPKEHSKN